MHHIQVSDIIRTAYSGIFSDLRQYSTMFRLTKEYYNEPSFLPPPPPLLLKGGRNFQIFGGEVATFLLLCSSILFTVCLCVCLWWKGGGGFPLLLFGSSVFSVSHARFSFKSLLYWHLVSFAHFWSILVVYRKCWLLY